MADSKKNLTKGKVIPLLSGLTWPMILGMMGIVIFNLVDTYFIGKLGDDELAAIGFTFPVIMFFTSITIGLGIGVSSLVSRNYHTAPHIETVRYSVESLTLAILVVIIFIVTAFLTIEPLFRALGASESMIPLIRRYIEVWYWGVLFVVFPMVGNNIIRGAGDTFLPGMIMVGSAVVNAILDPILIFGYGPIPALGLRGAALATVFARSLSFVAVVWILVKKYKLIQRYKPSLRHVLSTWKKVLFIALPAGLSMLALPLSIGIITRLLAEYGKEAVAAFGVVSKVEMFGIMVINALASVIIIFAGQNWVARKYSRLLEGVKYSNIFSILWGTFLMIIALLFSNEIAGIFSDNPEIVSIAADYIRIVTFSYGFVGFLMVGVSTFNGINKPIPGLLLTLLRMPVLYVPLAYLGSAYFGLKGIFFSALISNVLAGITAFFWVRITIKKSIHRL